MNFIESLQSTVIDDERVVQNILHECVVPLRTGLRLDRIERRHDIAEASGSRATTDGKYSVLEADVQHIRVAAEVQAVGKISSILGNISISSSDLAHWASLSHTVSENAYVFR